MDDYYFVEDRELAEASSEPDPSNMTEWKRSYRCSKKYESYLQALTAITKMEIGLQKTKPYEIREYRIVSVKYKDNLTWDDIKEFHPYLLGQYINYSGVIKE